MLTRASGPHNANLGMVWEDVTMLERSPEVWHNRLMAVNNRIDKVQKHKRTLVRFDVDRIVKAILRAAESIGGFHQDFAPGVDEKVFDACGSDENIASFLADAVVVCLNSDPHHHIANFPPTIEIIQDEVLHVLR